MSRARQHPVPRLVGVVLAGGASTRLGRDKTRLEVGGESLVERAWRRLAGVCGEVLIADRGRRLLGARAPSIADGAGAGPAAGLLGAARERPGERLLALACDLPLVPPSLLEALARAPSADLVLPATRGRDAKPLFEPLCARWSPRAVERLAANVAAGRFALHPLATDPTLVVRTFDRRALTAYGDPDRMLLNLNRPRDLERLDALLGEERLEDDAGAGEEPDAGELGDES